MVLAAELLDRQASLSEGSRRPELRAKRAWLAIVAMVVTVGVVAGIATGAFALARRQRPLRDRPVDP